MVASFHGGKPSLEQCPHIYEIVSANPRICYPPSLNLQALNIRSLVDACGFKIINSFLHIIHNEGEKLVVYPIGLLQDFCFPCIHTQEDVVYDVNNTLSTSQGFCVEHQ